MYDLPPWGCKTIQFANFGHWLQSGDGRGSNIWSRHLPSLGFAFCTLQVSLCFLNNCPGQDFPTPGWQRIQTEFFRTLVAVHSQELPSNYFRETENVTWTLPEWHHSTFSYSLKAHCQKFRQHCLRLLIPVPLHRQPCQVASMKQHREPPENWHYTALCLHG